MRIALFTYATQPRGGVLHALALGEALHDLGHDAVLHALDAGGGFVRRPRCRVVRVPLDAPRGDILPFVVRSIDTYVRALDAQHEDFDVYHAHDGISGNALATLVERGRIPAYVRTVHHLDDFGTGELAALQDRSIVSAARCLAVSRVWQERIARRYGREVGLVTNGVDAGRFKPARATERTRLRARLGADPGPLFVTIGGIEPRKNTLATLEAFAIVRQSVPSARLIVAGGASVFSHTEYRRAFAARAAALGLAANGALATPGVLPDARIVELLQAADAFVFPSLIEGFGLVILEALACGTPVIASNIAPFVEFLTARDALLVDPRDPAAIAAGMLRALDPRIAAQSGVRGPALARTFGWPACAYAHLDAYTAFAGPVAGAARA